MSPKQYFTLFFLFLIYINLGAFMFFSIERPVEEERRKLEKSEALEIRDLLRKHYAQGVPEAHLQLFSRLEDYCGRSLSLHTIPSNNASFRTLRDEDDDDDDDDQEPEEFEKPFLWTYYNSLLFVICTLSTIGYGNLAPTTRHGRVLDVVYGLFGIPFMGIVLTQMADYFGKIFLRAHHRYRSHEYQTRLSLFFDILTYTGLGMVIFIFFPAAIFVYFEDWTFDTGVYYAFVTLATIGYGDLVAGQTQFDSWVSDPYRFMVLVWIMFGLGYMLMIVGFLTRAMKSKKVRKLEHKLAHTIKQTQSKIWHEFSHDVTVLRRVLNEMYLLKIQPVYIERKDTDEEGVRRIKSCPNLTEWPILRKNDTSNESSSEEDEEEMAENFRKIAMRRRKANAENVMAPRIKKTVSDSDLSRIDRKATFGDDSSSVEPTLLLAKVVDALGTSVGSKFSLGEREEISRRASAKLNGIQLFSDEEILASERPVSRWSLGGRKRAISEQRDLEKKGVSDVEESKTWTAANSTDIERFLQMRANGELKTTLAFDTKSVSSMSSKSSRSDAEMRVPMSRMRRMSSAVVQLFSQTSKSKSQEIKELRDSKRKRATGSPGFMPTINGCKRLSLPSERQAKTTIEQSNYLSQITGRRGSVFAAIASELTPKDTQLPVSPVLEQTSVADFLRLLTSLQATIDSTQSIPSGIYKNSEHSIHRRKSVGHITRDTGQTPLTALFVPPTSNGVHLNNNLNLCNRNQRRASVAKTSNLLELNGKQGRRFSLIPPMDVDHPSGVINHKDVLQLRRHSRSSQNMTEGSTMSIPGLPSKGSRKSSLSGTAKYISAKLQSSFDSQKIGLPNLASSIRKFSIRPVPQSDIQANSQEEKSNTPVIQQCVPTITVEQFDSDSLCNKEEEGSLKDVIISRL